MDLKEIIFKDKWFVLVIVLIALLFLWFGIRPAYIISSCQGEARKAGVDWWQLEFTMVLEPLKKSQLQTEYIEDYYIRCLRDKGLSE
ncbi:MAG: hypothetical protein HYW45_03305 [Candidatus Daviesbacteria bacterium]|nr:MAG: hypothetical protein HYW45_03305 [Candidatus Daviesbacteria bacterium]